MKLYIIYVCIFSSLSSLCFTCMVKDLISNVVLLCVVFNVGFLMFYHSPTWSIEQIIQILNVDNSTIFIRTGVNIDLRSAAQIDDWTIIVIQIDPQLIAL